MSDDNRWDAFTADELGELRAGMERGPVNAQRVAEELWCEIHRAILRKTGTWPDDWAGEAIQSPGFRNIARWAGRKKR